MKGRDYYELYFNTLMKWKENEQKKHTIARKLRKAGCTRVAIYGMQKIGWILCNELMDAGIEVVYAIDRDAERLACNAPFTDIPDVRLNLPDDELEQVDLIIVTALQSYQEIKERLAAKYSYKIVSLKELLEDNWNKDSICHNIKEIKCYDENLVIYIIDYFKPRYVKMAIALRKKNFKLIFVMKGTAYNKQFQEKMYGSFLVRYYNTPEEAFGICKEYKPLAFHVFVEREYSTSYLLIKNKDQLGKIIYSEYDLLWGFCTNIYKKSAERALARERFCFEHADGICFRDFGGQFLEERSDYKIKGKWISFLDYCSGIKINKKIREDSELHLCYAGQVYSEKQYTDHTKIFQVAEKCEKEKVHFHVYPTIKNDDLFPTYISMSNSMKYFHFYHPLAYSDLIPRLSEFDYGIDFSDKETELKYVKDISEQLLIHGFANKYFDYLDAELPIIAHIPERQCMMFEERGVCIRDDILKVDFGQLREKRRYFDDAILKAKKEYSIDDNINRLVEFYRKV